MYRPFFFAFVLLLTTAPLLRAEEKAPAKAPEGNAAAPVIDKTELFKKFSESMNNVKMVGRFTVHGKDNGPLAKEEYTILGATKVEDGDKWLLQTRIKYGQHDLTIPLLLDILWAGDTPVITLTNFTIPGLGTFSSRVLIYDNVYAGTWTHGKAGGHLFGTIQKIKADDAAPKTVEKPAN